MADEIVGGTGDGNKVVGSDVKESTLDILMHDDVPDESDKVPAELALDEPDADEEVEEKPAKEEIEVEEDDEEKKPDVDEDDDEKFVTPASRKQILAAYPDFFKKFPAVERAMYRDQQFSEHFATPAEAKEVLERVENFAKFETDLFSGDIKSTLSAVKSEDPKAFTNLVDNYIGALYQVDPSAVEHLITNFHRQTVADMYKAAKESGDEDLQTAASILHKFVAPGQQWKAPEKFSKGDSGNDESKKISNERAQLQRERFESARDTLISKVDKGLRSTVDQYIDPKNMMSPFVKTNAIKAVIEKVNSIIESDKPFKKILDRHWDNAFKQNFNEDSIAKIRKAVFQRAKVDLPEVIKLVRREALNGISNRRKASDDLDEEPRKGHLPVGRTASLNSGNNKGPAKGESTKDFFLRD